MRGRLILGAAVGLVVGAGIDPDGGLAIGLALVTPLLVWAFSAPSRAPSGGSTDHPNDLRGPDRARSVFPLLRDARDRGELDPENYDRLLFQAEEHVRGLLREWRDLGRLSEKTYARLEHEIAQGGRAPEPVAVEPRTGGRTVPARAGSALPDHPSAVPASADHPRRPS